MILSDRRWRSLGADPLIVGRAIKTPDASITTIGVMSADVSVSCEGRGRVER